jgi:hypothetical protein
MLFKCYYHLHPMKEFEVECAEKTLDEDLNLDIF